MNPLQPQRIPDEKARGGYGKVGARYIHSLHHGKPVQGRPNAFFANKELQRSSPNMDISLPSCLQAEMYPCILCNEAWSLKCEVLERWQRTVLMWSQWASWFVLAMYATGLVPGRLVFQRQATATRCPGLAFGNLLISTIANKEIVTLVADHNSMQQSEHARSENRYS